MAHRLASQGRLIHIQRHGLQQLDVSRNLLARLYENDVTHHHVLAQDGRGMPVTHHLHLLLVIHLVEQVELPVGLQFEDECDACSQHDGHEDADGFEEHPHAVAACQPHPSVVFRAGDEEGEYRCYFEDEDQRVAVLPSREQVSEGSRQFLEEALEEGILLRWGQDVGTEVFSVLDDLLGGQSGELWCWFFHFSRI